MLLNEKSWSSHVLMIDIHIDIGLYCSYDASLYASLYILYIDSMPMMSP